MLNTQLCPIGADVRQGICYHDQRLAVTLMLRCGFRIAGISCTTANP